VIKSLFSSCSSFNPGHPDSDNKKTMGIEELLIPFREEIFKIANKYGGLQNAITLVFLVFILFTYLITKAGSSRLKDCYCVLSIKSN